MTRTWIRPVQLGLSALALSMAGWAGAQTAAPADAPPPPPAMMKKAPDKPPMGKHHRPHHRGDKAQHSGDRDPATREAGAAREEARRGKLDTKTPEDQFQRNALARCEVFKTDLDRQACVGRVRSGQVSGSVQDGGTITEYTQQVPVPQ
ncbi:hypothetical protein [Comamonas terrigena]|uniref:Uncharacterized protein n=1 Tax=Comamonas terrigena TaxID=32013 RepID=A0A2A7V0Z0_COMTR|nr:hypothetical protein [Comamonas terrigena]PEH91163.1 hypothetical protein CRM82_17785 [Comamonas terrigena]BBL25508.1 hypothetical protein CT3_29630 [Comamonas terrigena NBRC 13299]SUY70921.1 Uncharacterised protein [Comamonas terrigena]